MPFYTFSLLVIFLFAMLFILVARIDQRICRTELRLQALLNHYGLPDPTHVAPSAKVLALLEQPNGLIAAIKLYRSESGAGLKEAHDVLVSLKASASGRAVS